MKNLLTDTKIKNLKPRDKIYKISDRDGLYVAVLTSGTVSFRYDYRINGRRETLTIGKYGHDGIGLAQAREALIEAKKLINAGISPSAKKKDGIRLAAGVDNFSEYTVRYMQHVTLADSTRALKEAIIERDLLPALGKKQMTEITTLMVMDMCDRIVARGGRATALRAREIVSSVYQFANNRGCGFFNPAADIKPSAIATFTERERSLSPDEVGLFLREMKNMSGFPSVKMGLQLVLLTMVRKSELIKAVWTEIDFRRSRWTIPAERMKGSREHVIYLSRQAADIIVMLQQWAGGSQYLIPGRYSISKPLSNAALNAVITSTLKYMKEKGHDMEPFTVHDLRRTGSTLLHEAGYPSDWIEKALAHEQKGVRAVYNKAEYGRQREYMLQQWADMIDSWVSGEHTDLVPFSPANFEKWLAEID